MTARAVLIRPFAQRHLEASFDVWRRAWASAVPDYDIDGMLPGWRRQFAEELLPRRIVLAAETVDGAADPVLAGFAVFDPVRRWLDQLVVDPDRHRAGIGRLLIGTVGALAGGDIRFRVLKDNAGALRFYDRLGARREGEGLSPNSGWPCWLYVWTPPAGTAPAAAS
jgi:ribosomal protein S18 acetylase RimI-like enzyme